MPERIPGRRRAALALPLILSAALAACGGGGSGSGAGATGATSSMPWSVSNWSVAQTHVLPLAGRRWAQPSGTPMTLHLSGGREALLIVEAPGAPAELSVEGRRGGSSLGRVALGSAADFPPGETADEPYATTARAASLPAAWVQPGLEVRLVAGNGANAAPTETAWQPLAVGAETRLDIRTLPFYLFGATPALVSLEAASRPSPRALDEIHAKWPTSHLGVDTHPAGAVHWPELVVAPRGGNPAYVMRQAEDSRAGFDPLSAVLGAVGTIRNASGEGALAVQYYGALVMARGDGSFAGAGGGLGGGHDGAGDTTYSGIFIHEQGHATGMPHAGESWQAGGYPYPHGSLKGSAWGYDQRRGRFMSPRVPSTSSRFATCAGSVSGAFARQFDAQGRCIRQDPMQGGSGDQAFGDVYALFSDFNAGMVQRYLEGVATLKADGLGYSYSGGRVQASAASATGYRRWNSLTTQWVAVDPAIDANKGLYGVNGNYPVQRDVPVYTVVLTVSQAGTPGATQIYPPLGPYSGPLPRQFDPTSADDRAAIVPNTSPYPWYCHASGCDYTLRLTYADARVRHVLLRGAFRPWFGPTGAPAAESLDPVKGASFRTLAVNVPADAALATVELLATPMGWQGLPDTPSVLARRDLP